MVDVNVGYHVHSASQPIMAGLDPAIHQLSKKVLAKNDGPAGQARG
jgi:hypothetical protein